MLNHSVIMSVLKHIVSKFTPRDSPLGVRRSIRILPGFLHPTASVCQPVRCSDHILFAAFHPDSTYQVGGNDALRARFETFFHNGYNFPPAIKTLPNG